MRVRNVDQVGAATCRCYFKVVREGKCRLALIGGRAALGATEDGEQRQYIALEGENARHTSWENSADCFCCTKRLCWFSIDIKKRVEE